MKKITTLAALFTLAMICGGCTMTVEGDWPGGWSNLDNTQHTNQYKQDAR